MQRKTISTLWNTYSFFVLYANLDDFKPTRLNECKLNLMDKWLLSQLNALEARIEKYMADFDFTTSTREIAEFIDNLSNWYVRRSRERFWLDGVNEDKTAAFNTLYYVLIELTKMLAPFMPFISDNIYQNLATVLPNKVESVHLCDYPQADKSLINETLNEQMREVIKIVELGRAARNASSIKNRQPLSNLYIYSTHKIDLNQDLLDIVADDLNVKEVSIIATPEKYISFELKPQLKTLGPKYGKNLNIIREYLNNCDAYEVVNTLESGGEIVVDKEEGITLSNGDVLIYPHSLPNFTAETDAGITIILDTTLTQELINEGYAREFISKVQNLRKESGLAVEDNILVHYETDDTLSRVLDKYQSTISSVILANELTRGSLFDNVIVENINGIECKISIQKV